MSVEEAAEKPVFCVTCGARNPRTNRFCGDCGGPIVFLETAAAPQTATPQTAPVVEQTPVPPPPAAPARPTVAIPDNPIARERELERLLTAANLNRVRAQLREARKTLDQALVIAEAISPKAAAPVHEQIGDMLAAEERWPEAKERYETALKLSHNDRPSAERKLGEVTVHLSDLAAFERLGGELQGEDIADILRTPRGGKRNAGIAMLASLIPGFGQFYCGAFIKGAILLGIFITALLVISLAPEKSSYLEMVFGTVMMKTVKGSFPAYLHVCGFAAFASWLYSLVDAPFTAKSMSSENGPGVLAAPMGNRADWEP
jgi:hypothetical protein